MSQPIPVWVGTVDARGDLHLDVARGFKAWLKAALANHAVEVIVRRQRKKASRKQHGYWRAYVIPEIAKAMGHLKYEHDAVHDMVMRELCGLKEGGDPRFPIRKSSADFDTVEFNEWLIEQAQVWAAEKLGLVLADPDPNWKQRHRRAA